MLPGGESRWSDHGASARALWSGEAEGPPGQPGPHTPPRSRTPRGTVKSPRHPSRHRVMPAKVTGGRLLPLPAPQRTRTRLTPQPGMGGLVLEPGATCLLDPDDLRLCGRALTRLRFKVFQVYFILIFVYVLMSAHHHNCKFKLTDKNRKLRYCKQWGNSHLRQKSSQDFSLPPDK